MYKIKKTKLENFVNDDLDPNSSDESDSESDSKSDDENDNESND